MDTWTGYDGPTQRGITGALLDLQIRASNLDRKIEHMVKVTRRDLTTVNRMRNGWVPSRGRAERHDILNHVAVNVRVIAVFKHQLADLDRELNPPCQDASLAGATRRTA